MAVVASATGVALGMTAGTIGAGLVGGAVLGAGAGALYSAVTGDGNILNSALTGALIGGGVGAAGAATGPALMGEAAGATATSGAATAAQASPALQAAQGLTSANVAGLEQAALSQGVFAEGAAALPGAGLQVAPEVIAPSLTPAVSSAAIDPTTGLMAKTASDKLSNKEILGYGLAGTAALSLLGSRNQSTLSGSNTGTSGPAMIRPYTYSQTKNPNYGQPGEPYFIQTNTPGTPYKAATGGLMAIGGPVERMSQGMMGGQQNMYPQSQQVNTNFATPTQMPASAEIIRSDYDSKTSPYTGDIMMARGGIARYADGGSIPEDLLSQIRATQTQTPPPPAMPAPVAPATLVVPSTTYAPAAGSTQEQVNNMYRDVLGRAPDASGGQFWGNAVNNGITPEQLRSQFFASPENVANERLRTQISDYNRNIADSANQEYNIAPPPLAGLPGGGQNASTSDLKKIINQYYKQNLGRQGDGGGVDFWTNAVQNTGMKLGDVVKNIRTSPEGTVRNLYQELLGRTPDAEGGQYWTNAVANGLSADALRNELTNSQEYLNLHPEIVSARQAQAEYEAAPITQANFDAQAYLAANQDVARAGADPWRHYIQYGQNEGRQAPRLAYQAPSTTTSQADIDAYMAAHPTNTRTYNAATKTYSTPIPSAAEVAAWRASQASQDDPTEDPAFKAWQLQQWQASQNSSGGGAAGGLMPNALRYAKGGKSYDGFNFDDLSKSEKKYFLEVMANSLAAPKLPGSDVGPENSFEKYMMSQAPQGAVGRIGATRLLDDDSSVRAGLSGIAMAIPGKHGVTTMPGAVDVGYRSSRRNQEDPYLDLTAYRSLQAMPGKGYAQGVNANYTIPFAAGGGIPAYNLGGYSDGGRLLKGPGDGMSDNIPASIADKQPARLADGEFVVPADVVSHLGNGSTDAGAKRLYSMMDNVRKARTGNKKQGKQIKADKFLPT